MKKVLLLPAALMMCLTICACGHLHTWDAANCISPKTCSECGETQGEALGHTWKDATCTAAKTCAACGETQGEALGHTWKDATCTAARTCTACGETQGEALGHDTVGLTCTNDATCSRCNALIRAPGHDLTEATCNKPAKCKVCGETQGKALGHTSTSGVCSRCGLEIYETISGRGDDVLSGIAVGDGIYRVHFTHSGRRNFVVKSYDAANDRELLINEIGSYNGYVLLAGTGPYAFEITADGNWTYTIERLDVIADTSFAGKGDYVTGLCSISSGAWKFTHDGSSNFVIRLYSSDGRDLLVNEIGAYDGKKMLSIPSGSYVFFEITADGNWTIEKS